MESIVAWKTGICWHEASEQEERAGDTTGATLAHHQMGRDIFTISSLPNSPQQVPILLSSTAESWLCKERRVKGLPPYPQWPLWGRTHRCVEGGEAVGLPVCSYITSSGGLLRTALITAGSPSPPGSSKHS